MHSKLVLGTLALGVATFTVGCYGRAVASGEVEAPVVVAEEPTLVAVDSGVWVVRDYDYPVYYVDDYYWSYRDDVWQRSRAYDGGWVTIEVNIVPRVIVSRDHHAYVHYRGAPNAPTRKAPRQDRDHDRPGRPDEQRAAPPARAQDREPREAEHRDERHDAAPGHDRDDSSKPSERPGDHDASPPHDGRPGAGPTPQHEHEGPRDNPKPEAHEKKNDKGAGDRGKPNKDDHQRGDEKGRRDNK